MAQREVKKWITVNGVHVPIFEGQSVKQAVREHIDQIKAKRGKAENEVREMTGNETGKLRNSEKAYIENEEHKRRREEGVPTKYGSKDHSKLSQHSEIQKIANEHVKKIWSKQGGVANKELYDEADKFAEKHNLDKAKVRKAAMKAMNEKQMAEIDRRKKEAASVKYDTYNPDEDKYADKLSVGDKVKIKRNGKEYSAVISEKDVEIHSTLPNGAHRSEPAYEATFLSDTGEVEYNIAGANKTRITPKEIQGVASKQTETQKQISKDLDEKEKQISQHKADADKLNESLSKKSQTADDYVKDMIEQSKFMGGKGDKAEALEWLDEGDWRDDTSFSKEQLRAGIEKYFGGSKKQAKSSISTSATPDKDKSLARKASDNAANAKLRHEVADEVKHSKEGSKQWKPNVGDRRSNVGHNEAKNELFNAPVGTVIQMDAHSSGDYVGEYTRTEDGWVGSQKYKSGRVKPPTVKTAEGFAMQVSGNDVKVISGGTSKLTPATPDVEKQAKADILKSHGISESAALAVLRGRGLSTADAERRLKQMSIQDIQKMMQNKNKRKK